MKYICRKCKYSTNNKYDFNRHETTLKHTELYNDESDESDESDDEQYYCSCGKKYKCRNGLWKHKKRCEHNILKAENKDEVSLLTGLVKTLVEEGKEFRDTIVTMQQQPTIINTQNNTFNLQFFLNETCKDAMNLDDFVDSIQVTIEDLKILGKKGYVEGMSNLFIKNLEELDISQRPLHCSDEKRETIYIRDKKSWKKENDQKNHLTGIATDICRVNTIALQNDYQKKYPHCLTDTKSKEHEEYGKIVYEAFGGKLDIDKANKKLFRNIMKATVIKKNIF
jgi:hypothetical protein